MKLNDVAEDCLFNSENPFTISLRVSHLHTWNVILYGKKLFDGACLSKLISLYDCPFGCLQETVT